MTREVAIRNLEMIRIAFVNPVTKEQRKLIDDTVDMAISALSAQNEAMTEEELAERETTYLDHYTKIKEWAKNNGFVLVTEEWYDKARAAYYWRYYGER